MNDNRNEINKLNKKRAAVLLVEDSPADQIIVKRALEDAKVQCDLFVVENGSEALKYLRSKAPYNDKKQFPFPDLILLDINMPVMDGKETLEAIREDNELRAVPIIMLTTSDSDKDIKESYFLGANAFVTKPVGREEIINAMIHLEKFWFELVTLPVRQ